MLYEANHPDSSDPSSELNYLTEILDSAQEGFEYLFVNGEKYVFSEQVLEDGKHLFKMFGSLKKHLKTMTEAVRDCTISTESKLDVMKRDLVHYLIDFDKAWAMYENIYVSELMIIEHDARRFIYEAIKIEESIT